MEMNTKEDSEIVEAMERYGGSFVKALAVCFQRADYINYKKLKNTFSNYWDEYREMIKK